MFKSLVAPAIVGVTGFTVNATWNGTALPHPIPVGRPEQDSVTGTAVPDFKVAVILTDPPPPGEALKGPLFDNE
jgi:hypothetical protein